MYHEESVIIPVLSLEFTQFRFESRTQFFDIFFLKTDFENDHFENDKLNLELFNKNCFDAFVSNQRLVRETWKRLLLTFKI